MSACEYENIVYRKDTGSVVLDLYTEPKNDVLSVFIQDHDNPDAYRFRRLAIRQRFDVTKGGIDHCIYVDEAILKQNDMVFGYGDVVKKVRRLDDDQKKIGGHHAVKMVGAVGIAKYNGRDNVTHDEILNSVAEAFCTIKNVLSIGKN